MNNFKGATILITGGSGSIGSELLKTLLKYNPKQVRIFTIDENGLFEMSAYSKLRNVELRLGDVRDQRSVDSAVEGCDYVFHAAALKHIPFCELNPYEAITTNVIGTQNVIDSSIKRAIPRFVLISTDKAVNPASTMGATKLLAEKLMIQASKLSSHTVLSAVRFGNVVMSRGSVVILFEKQIASGQPLTITDPSMTRFIMAPADAASLVLRSSILAKSGEIFVLRMNTVTIGDLAEASKRFFCKRINKNPDNIPNNIIGVRPGEKMHEELLNANELNNIVTLDDFYIVNPNSSRAGVRVNVKEGLSSERSRRLRVDNIVKELEVVYGL